MKNHVKNIFQVVNKAKKPTILMDGYIGKYDKVNVRDFQRIITDLEENQVSDCEILINSGGGSTIEGLTIGDFMKNSSISFHGIVVGMAASMAGGILMFCDKRSMYKNARVMTHKVKAGQWGEASALRSMADLCDQEEQKIVTQFIEATGKAEKEVLKWFKPGIDKWFTADDCLKNNIVQEIIEPPKKTKNTIPENVTDAAKLFDAYQPMVANYLPKQETQTDFNIMNKTEILAVMAAAGFAHKLTENSSDEDFKKELEGVFASANKANEYKSKLDGYLKTNAETIVNQAVKEGKIPANEKQQWIDDYIVNSGMVTRAIARMSGMPNPNNGVQIPKPNNGEEPAHELLKGREEWTFDKWQDEAPQDLQTIEDEAPEAFDIIFNKQFNK